MVFRSSSGLVRGAAVVAAALVLTACSSDAGPAAADPSEGEAAELVEKSALTGLVLEEGRPQNPVFVVKIENTSSGAPQIGLSAADLVVEELVEGGLTRLAALYYTRLPDSVGHVRSLRGTDAGIARPVNGRVVATGGAGPSIQQLDRAGVPILAEDRGRPGFSLDPAKSAPYNRLINLVALAKDVKNVQPEQPFFSFAEPDTDADLGTGARPATSATVRFSASSSTQWTFADGTWVRTNGHARDEFRADNLIIMYCPVGDAGYLDPAGNPVPETTCDGSGRAMVLRDGKALDLTWFKENAKAATTFETSEGAPFEVSPGKTFLELVPEGDGDVTVGG
ncbi:DUF3048 domain-containing protein [Aeromicrobium sp. CF3.5]|uniref:DUF3048 domain-containing protein n=1 Tax=Aeromicrobium sp. CF3.5 TaxID=3373078 RepID=UPI003EE44C73